MVLHAILISLVLLLASCTGNLIGDNDASSVRAPTHAQVNDWKSKQTYQKVKEGKWLISGDPKKTLINGTKVKPEDYPAIVWFGFCTGSVIGPRTVLTAAHCAESGQVLSFTIKGESYTAIATQSPLYLTKDLDLALAYVDKKIEGIDYKALQIERDARQNERLMLTGFGCIQPGGGGGGNDGTLRIGHAVLSSPYIRNYDLILKPLGDDKAALCFGDSGGPVFRENGLQIAVNSKGNIVDTSYVTRTDHPDSEAFFRNWAEKHNTTICGLNSDCKEEIPEDKEPIQFVFENEHIQLQGIIK